MQTSTHERAQNVAKDGAQFVIAVFDDWDTLHAIVEETTASAPRRSGAVLHARKDAPPKALRSHLLQEMAQLRFARSHLRIACTAGQLADELSARLLRGARNLAEALQGWVSTEQADELEGHLERGRLVLCIELDTPEDFSEVCGRLVNSSPHMVGLCTINFDA
jgi:hypothetical protein